MIQPFDVTTTDMPLFDSMLQKPNYFRDKKGMAFEISMMSPDDYLSAIDAIGVSSKIFRQDTVDRYSKLMLEGVKFPMPVIEAQLHNQEGRHRALAAKKIGVSEIPVMIVTHLNKVSKIVTKISTIKEGAFIRYFYDALGAIIGRIETDDNGDSTGYDSVGRMVGRTFNGQTFNDNGEIIAQQDILSSLLIKEEKKVALKFKQAKSLYKDKYGDWDGDSLDAELRDNFEEYLKTWVEIGRESVHDIIFEDKDLYPKYMENMKKKYTEEELETEKHINDKDMWEFITNNSENIAEDYINSNDAFREWAWDEISEADLYEAFKKVSKIIKKKDGYYVMSEKGKNLGGPYSSEEKAKKRLKMVEFFKHKEGASEDILWYNRNPYDSHNYMQRLDYIIYGTPDDQEKAWKDFLKEPPTSDNLMRIVKEAPEKYRLLALEEIKHNRGRKSYKMADMYDYYSITPESLGDASEDIPEYKEVKELLKTKGKFNLYDIVNTPMGRGRIVRKQVEDKPYSYTVRLTKSDDSEVFEEKQLKKISARLEKTWRVETDNAYIIVYIFENDLEDSDKIQEIIKDKSLSIEEKEQALKTEIVVLAEDKINSAKSKFGLEIRYTDIGLKSVYGHELNLWNYINDRITELEEMDADQQESHKSSRRHKLNSSLQKAGAKVGWLRDRWITTTRKLMDVVAEVSDTFKIEQAQGSGRGIDLFKYYSSVRYEEVEAPLREDSITKTQADRLINDLLTQFKIELYDLYGISAKDVKDQEPEITDEKEAVNEAVKGPMYGDTNIYPYKGTGVGEVATPELNMIVNEPQTREIRSMQIKMSDVVKVSEEKITHKSLEEMGYNFETLKKESLKVIEEMKKDPGLYLREEGLQEYMLDMISPDSDGTYQANKILGMDGFDANMTSDIKKEVEKVGEDGSWRDYEFWPEVVTEIGNELSKDFNDKMHQMGIPEKATFSFDWMGGGDYGIVLTYDTNEYIEE